MRIVKNLKDINLMIAIEPESEPGETISVNSSVIDSD
jgi:hypothetical protein